MNKQLNEMIAGDIGGLTEAEAATRLRADGYNELPYAKKDNIFAAVIGIVSEPMFLLLMAGGVIYLLLGSIRDALMLLGFVFAVIGITFYQEQKTDRALTALRDLSSPRAMVIRDGKQGRIPGREVVCGDIIIISEGDRIPADAALISCTNLLIDESLLTGESVPVRKAAGGEGASIGRPGGDDIPAIYSGTLAVQGIGIARVASIGANTELGRIGAALRSIKIENTLLQIETARIVKSFAVIGISICALVVIIYGLTRDGWLNGVLAGITLAMALLPEEFPVVLTIFLALGAWRISKKGILTRRIPAVETLGAATVLCVDKTGTLTQNMMSVQSLFAKGLTFDIGPGMPVPEEFHEVVEFGILASQTSPFDPMEKAVRDLGRSALYDTEHIHDDWEMVHEYPLSRDLLAMSRVWVSPDRADYVIAAKGAPEAIADVCHMNDDEMAVLNRHIEALASDGLRVIGVAKAEFRKTDLPVGQHDFAFEFLGLIALADPVRPGVADAIKECYGAGIKVVMITGDYPSTARNVAAQIGLKDTRAVITGPELNAMNDGDLSARIRTECIFARVVPEQKLRIVEAFKRNGEVVAMTGDGVNDAPALKAAHIGIAMGARGTDVAREASSIVLTDDDFASIVYSVRMGRRIFDNIKKAVVYILAVHVPIAGMSLIPVLLNLPLLLQPVHIVFLELIIDPACSVVFEAEPEEDGIMLRPPRKIGAPLFSGNLLAYSALQGLFALVTVFAVFMAAIRAGAGEETARTLAFTALITANLSLILTNRSWSATIFHTLQKPNPALWWVLGGALSFLSLVLYVPYLMEVFHLSAVNPIYIIISAFAGAASTLWFEALKLVKRSSGAPAW